MRGPLGVAVGHSVAYFLFWLVSTIHVGRVTGVDSRSLIRNAMLPVLVVSLPAGVLAFAATRLPFEPIGQLVLGVSAALLYFGLIALVNRTVRADVKILFSFVRRALGGGLRSKRPR